MTIQIRDNTVLSEVLPGPQDLMHNQAYMCIKYRFPCVLSRCGDKIVYLNDGDILRIVNAGEDMRFRPISITIEINEA